MSASPSGTFIYCCMCIYLYRICGPYAVLMSYISEFHGAKYRAPILLLSGIFFSLANVGLSGLAWWIIPENISLSLLDGFVGKSTDTLLRAQLYRWDIASYNTHTYIYACGINKDLYTYIYHMHLLYYIPTNPDYVVFMI